MQSNPPVREDCIQSTLLLGFHTCRHVSALCKRAHTIYILPTLLSHILMFFLKSINLKIIIINNVTKQPFNRASLIDVLKACICGARAIFLNGVSRLNP